MVKFSQPPTIRLPSAYYLKEFFKKGLERYRMVGGQKGVSLYLAIVIMTALLAIVLGVTGILVSQLRMIRGMEDSVIAFFAADTGNEKGLKEAYLSPDPATLPATYDAFLDIDGNGTTGESGAGENCPENLSSYPGDACYEVSVYASSDAANCVGTGAGYYCIKSVGSYRETKRAIETNI